MNQIGVQSTKSGFCGLTDLDILFVVGAGIFWSEFISQKA